MVVAVYSSSHCFSLASCRAPGADFSATRGRLNLEADRALHVGWRPSASDVHPWWGVDLGGEFVLTGIVTQGGYEVDGARARALAAAGAAHPPAAAADFRQVRRPAWVSRYRVLVSLDGVTWDSYGPQVEGNADADTPVLRQVDAHLVEPLRARYVRIAPTACAYGSAPDGSAPAAAGPVEKLPTACALRVELLGHSPCSTGRCTKSGALGVRAGGVLPAAAFSASSRARGATPAHAGRLHAKQSVFREGGWSPSPDSEHRTALTAPAAQTAAVAVASPMGHDWLQVDLGRELEVNAVATQGAASRPSYVSKYELLFSNDGRHWAKANRVFVGNSDNLQVVKVPLPRPVLARYVRFVPVAFEAAAAVSSSGADGSPAGPAAAAASSNAGSYGLRVEVFGPAGYRPGEIGCRLQAGAFCPCSDRSSAPSAKEAPGAHSSCGCGRTVPALLRGAWAPAVGGVAVPADVLSV